MSDNVPASTLAIVGLGPTGGVLACLLGARGVRVDVFERDAEVHPRPRGVHLDGEAMRVLQQIGVAERIAPAAMPVKGMHLIDADGRLLYRYAVPDVPGPLGWADGYMVHQPELERELRRRAAEHPSVTLHTGHEVERIDVLPGGEGASLSVRDAGGGVRTVRARFVIGCCGARSITRAAVGAGWFDYGRHQPWLVVDVMLRREVTLPEVTVQHCDPARPATYVPMPGNRRRFEIRVMPGDDPDALVGDESVRGLLARWLHPDDYEVERAAVYTFHALVADRWRRGPLLIAGDAAHQMPPFLGQGMCAGIRDAANLAWKLELVARGVAAPSLLDTYQAEREPHVRRIIEADLYLGDLIQPAGSSAPADARHGAASRGSPPTGARRPGALTPPVYPLGPGLCAPTSAAGTPFPQPRLEDGVMHDGRLGPGFTLVGAVTPSPAARRVMERLGAAVLTTPVAAIRDWLSAHGARAALVRPDRIVLAAVSDAPELDAAMAPLAAHLLPRSDPIAP